MDDLEPLGLNALAWQFLSKPERYVAASALSERPLVPTSTARQFRTARDILLRLNGSTAYGIAARKGVLLADDVGLGKTTVGALVAWVVARAGEGTGRVRILAPNETMRRRWVDELARHVPLLTACTRGLEAATDHLRDTTVKKLAGGRIQVATHFHAAAEKTLSCDLLIIDEAHRAKGEKSRFAQELEKRKKHAKRILFLTATPFSIDIDELVRMLRLIGAGANVTRPVHAYAQALDRLHARGAGHDAPKAAKELVARAEAAIAAMQPFVIRHGVDDLPNERDEFGISEDWPIDVPPASIEELELVVRADRMLRTFWGTGRATNDARFHVGRHQLTERIDEVEQALGGQADDERRDVLVHQTRSIRKVRDGLAEHPKVRKVAEVVAATAAMGEKVVVFCDHHATTREFALELANHIPPRQVPALPPIDRWHAAWLSILEPRIDVTTRTRNFEQLRDTFVQWLCSDQIRAQIASWLPNGELKSVSNLRRALEQTRVRDCARASTIAHAAIELLLALTAPDSASTLGVLRAAASSPYLLPGYSGPIIASTHAPAKPALHARTKHLFLGDQQPDTLLAIFNSPIRP